MLQASIEYLRRPVPVPLGATITAADISVCFGPLDSAAIWHPVDSYVGRSLAVLVGPGTAVGMLPAGIVPIYIRVIAPPETVIREAAQSPLLVVATAIPDVPPPVQSSGYPSTYAATY